MRDQPLLGLCAPVLFVQGSRDPLRPLELLEEVRARMSAPSTLHVVEDGDHSLAVARRTLQARGETQEVVDPRCFGWIRDFVAALPEA